MTSLSQTQCTAGSRARPAAPEQSWPAWPGGAQAGPSPRSSACCSKPAWPAMSDSASAPGATSWRTSMRHAQSCCEPANPSVVGVTAVVVGFRRDLPHRPPPTPRPATLAALRPQPDPHPSRLARRPARQPHTGIRTGRDRTTPMTPPDRPSTHWVTQPCPQLGVRPVPGSVAVRKSRGRLAAGVWSRSAAAADRVSGNRTAGSVGRRRQQQSNSDSLRWTVAVRPPGRGGGAPR